MKSARIVSTLSILLWSLSPGAQVGTNGIELRGAGRRKGVVPEARRRLGQATAHATKTTPNPETDMSRKFLRILSSAMLGASLIALAPPSPQSQIGVTMQATTREQRLRQGGRGSAHPLRNLRQADPIVVLAGGFGDASSMQQVIGPAFEGAAGHCHRHRRSRPHRAARDADEP
jgi:hypothetical protein